MTRPPSPTVTKTAAIAGLCVAILCATVSLHAAPVSAEASSQAGTAPALKAPAR